MKSVLIVSIALVVAAGTYVALNTNEPGLVTENELNNSDSESPSPSLPSQPSFSAALSSSTPSKPDSPDTLAEPLSSLTRQNNASLDPSRFSSEQALNQSFIYPDNTVSRTSLNDFFLHSDFHQWVDNISAMQKSQASIEREIKLFEQLTNKLGGRVFGEEYACAGRICVVQFSYDADVSKEELSDLSEFDKNYVFMNHAANAGEGQQFRAIYIQTDDPSTLTIGD
ncbi:hypothetical protein [Bowmanella denitrificans]|uniref:hypothetical protein n=1 Tax=Bowmanella denitrificans TaxID=366582 RepID=UPI000C9B7F3F|nr:hypothetical protein [Bowmanella denitrificans]